MAFKGFIAVVLKERFGSEFMAKSTRTRAYDNR
jgi:hypothetical protein